MTTSDPLLNSESFYDRYVLNGRVGETYDITVTTTTFRPWVGARARSRAEDDFDMDEESHGSYTSKLLYTVTTAGPQIIRVTSSNPDEVGDYTISVLKK